MLAGAALLAGWFDPVQPAVHADLIFWILAAYAACAGGLVIVKYSLRTPRGLGVAAHAADIVVFAVLLNLTEAPASPFFVLLNFSLLGAALRWGWRGAAWTTAVLVVLYAASAPLSAQIAPASGFDLNRFVLRCTHLVTMGGMLVFFGVHQERISDEMARLAGWPVVAPTAGPPVREALDYAAAVFGAGRVLLVHSDALEPWIEVAEWCAPGELRTERLPPGTVDPVAPDGLAETSFLAAGNTVLVHRGGGRLEAWDGPGLNEGLRRRYRIDGALCFPIRTEELDGWLFVPDRADAAAEDFLTGGLVAARIAVAFERAAVREAQRAAKAAEERLRLGRDLHDGVLQSLAGAVLKLQAGLREHDVPSGLQARVAEVCDLLAAEQRELRGFILRLHPGSSEVASVPQVELLPFLEQLAGALRLQWGLEVAACAKPASASVAGQVAHQLRQMVREAAANAARHGGAHRLSVSATVGADALRLELADDGAGLPQHGAFGIAELRRLGIGPRSLRERVAALGGALTVESSPAGTRLAIVFPLDAAPPEDGHPG